MTETHQTLAPVVLLDGPTGPLVSLTFAGEWVLRVDGHRQAGRRQGGIRPGWQPDLDHHVLTLTIAGVPALSLTTQQLLTQKGLVLPLPGIGEIAIGEDPRAIGGNDRVGPRVGGQRHRGGCGA